MPFCWGRRAGNVPCWAVAAVAVAAAATFNLLMMLPGALAQGALLAPLVRQGDVEAVDHNLGLGSIPNEADDTGDTALLAAAETGQLEIAELLMLYHANGSMPAALNGQTPFVAAAHALNSEMIRLFLKYGNSPDAKDRQGNSPRQIILDAHLDHADSEDEADVGMDAILDMLDLFDKGGAEAFEDPPGTWLRLKSDKHEGAIFFFNSVTSMSTYLPQTSCSWGKTTHPDHDDSPLFVNTLTKQTKWTRPKALDWFWTEKDAGHQQGFWHNPQAGVSQWEDPGEPSPELLEEMRRGYYWHNPISGETTWDDPAEHRWRQLQDVHGVYWFHPRTGESTREAPLELEGWQRFWSAKDDKYYYVGPDGKAQWDAPQPFAWERHASRPDPAGRHDEL